MKCMSAVGTKEQKPCATEHQEYAKVGPSTIGSVPAVDRSPRLEEMNRALQKTLVTSPPTLVSKVMFR
eukprot:symbB.v1.2.027008.t1/scaffold2631.1/size74421/3